jgi:RimJ/RimL family protein N-acetyltransferase
MNTQPTLDNELVLLRPLKKEDFSQLYSVAKDPLIWQQHPSKRYELNEFQNFFDEALSSKGALTIIDKASDQIIGSSRFQKYDNIKNAVVIGWTYLSKDYWGGKYNGSIKSMMLKYAFKNVDNVIFYIAKCNIRSQKAIEKINAKQLDSPDAYNFYRDEPNTVTYVINKKNYYFT